MSEVEEFTPEQISNALSRVMAENLDPLSPLDALNMYIGARRDELAVSTLRTHKSRLSFFIEWCRQEHIENLNDLTGRDILRFKEWRTEFLDSPNTIRTNMRTLRVFLRKCVHMEAVKPSLPEKVPIPTVPKDQRASDDILPAERAADILAYLDTYHYGTRDHVILVLLAEAGFRTCTLHGLDIQDFTAGDTPKLELRHRPDSGTRLKNKSDSERPVYISEYAADVLEDYIDGKRPDARDDEGRRPLLATSGGRLSKTSIRKACYRWTRPCMIGAGCPHGKEAPEFDDCEARKSSEASRCESSRSPHPVRRGYISNELDQGVPGDVVDDRCDLSEDVRKLHYDRPDEDARAEIRREIREQVYGDQRATPYGRGSDED